MREEEVLVAAAIEEACLTLEELARAAGVEPQWIMQRIEEGYLSVAGGASAAHWRFSAASLRRACRLRALERDFDAAPELAALVADLLEEIERLRARAG